MEDPNTIPLTNEFGQHLGHVVLNESAQMYVDRGGQLRLVPHLGDGIIAGRRGLRCISLEVVAVEALST